MSVSAGQWEGAERTASHMLKCKLWARRGSLPVPLLIPCVVLVLLPDLSELPSPWSELRPIILEPCPTAAYTQWWPPGSAGVGVTKPASSGLPGAAGRALPRPEFPPLQSSCDGEDPGHRQVSRQLNQTLPDNAKGQEENQTGRPNQEWWWWEAASLGR